MSNEIVNSILKDIASSVVEKSFVAIATAAGFPAIAFSAPLAKGIILGLFQNSYNDCSQMTLSVRETDKLNQLSSIALQTFWRLAEEDGVIAWEMNIDPAYIDYAAEVAEHVTLEGIKQSERKKIDILGRYYGKQFYKGNTDWQDMHQMITMVSNLTFRQIVLIRLISEGFKQLDRNLFISNPSACVEVNRLLDYGIWQTDGSSFGTNDSWMIQLECIIPTIYSDQVSDALMLDDLSEEDINRTIDSLKLTPEGLKQERLTLDEYKRDTTFKVEGEKLVLPGGKTYGGDPDEGMFLYDLARGK